MGLPPTVLNSVLHFWSSNPCCAVTSLSCSTELTLVWGDKTLCSLGQSRAKKMPLGSGEEKMADETKRALRLCPKT